STYGVCRPDCAPWRKSFRAGKKRAEYGCCSERRHYTVHTLSGDATSSLRDVAGKCRLSRRHGQTGDAPSRRRLAHPAYQVASFPAGGESFRRSGQGVYGGIDTDDARASHKCNAAGFIRRSSKTTAMPPSAFSRKFCCTDGQGLFDRVLSHEAGQPGLEDAHPRRQGGAFQAEQFRGRGLVPPSPCKRLGEQIELEFLKSLLIIQAVRWDRNSPGLL